MIEEQSFNIWIPMEIEDITKSGSGKEEEKEMLISGIASTKDVDTDGESLDPNGFDLSYFKSQGHINWNHQAKDDPLMIIGEPIEAEIKNDQMVVKARLFSKSELAKKVYKTAQILRDSGSSRKLGFSIEGKATKRDENNPKNVMKARITNLAIAPTPKNAKALMDVCKAVNSPEPMDYDTGNLIEATWGKDSVIVKSDMSIELKTDGVGIFLDSVMVISKAIESGEISPEAAEQIRAQFNGVVLSADQFKD